eukprot:15479449-Alexandrium_andersonii.AAC.1
MSAPPRRRTWRWGHRARGGASRTRDGIVGVQMSMRGQSWEKAISRFWRARPAASGRWIRSIDPGQTSDSIEHGGWWN